MKMTSVTTINMSGPTHWISNQHLLGRAGGQQYQKSFDTVTIAHFVKYGQAAEGPT
jgi:hypothetical protein